MGMHQDGDSVDVAGEVARFAERLQAARTRAGLTQRALAARAGVTPYAVGVLERAERAPTLVTLVQIARAVGLRPAGLVADQGAPVKNGWAAGISEGERTGRRAAGDTLRTFGTHLRRRREAAGFSQDDLSQRAAVDRAGISLIERGKRSPNLRTILRLADALGVGPGGLLDDIGCASNGRHPAT